MHSNSLNATALPLQAPLRLGIVCSTRKTMPRYVVMFTFSYRLLVKAACRRHLGFVGTPNSIFCVLSGTPSALRHTLVFLVVTLTRRPRDEVRRAYNFQSPHLESRKPRCEKDRKTWNILCTLSASYCCAIPSPPITRSLACLVPAAAI